MADMVGSLFLITKGLKDKIQGVFLEKNTERAKLYFEAYILDNENPIDYKLYRIADINEKKRINENYAFITGGYEIKSIKENKKQKINQLKMDIENNYKNKNQIEIIQNLFNGRRIEC